MIGWLRDLLFGWRTRAPGENGQTGTGVGENDPANENPAKAGATKPAATTRAEEDRHAQQDVKFVSALAKLLNGRPEVPAGNLNIVGLKAIKDRTGPKWPRIADYVHSLAQRTIEQHLDAADIYTRCGELDYLVVFSHLSKEAAQIKCAKISEELHAHLLGADDLEKVHVKSIVGVAGKKFLLESISIKERIRGLADQVASDGVVVAPVPKPVPNNAGNVSAKSTPSRQPGPSAVSGSTGAAPLAQKPAGPRSAPPATVIETAAIQAPAPDLAFEGDAPVRTVAAGAIKAPAPAEAQKALEWLDNSSVIYRPIWDLGRSVISTYMCTPHRGSGPASLAGYRVLPVAPVNEEILELDLFSLETTCADVRELFQNELRFRVVIPVHFSTLTSRKMTRRYLQRCERIPREIRRYLKFQVSGAPRGVPSTRLGAIGAVLKNVSQSLIWETDLQQRDFSAFTVSGFSGVCVDLTKDKRPERAIIQDMNAFAAAAEEHKLTCHVHGIRSSSLGIAAGAAGFSFIDGDRVKGVTDFPEHLAHYDWQQFFKEFVQAAA